MSIALNTRLGRMTRMRSLSAVVFANPLSAIGTVGWMIIVLIAVLGPVLAPYDPLHQDMIARFAPPGPAHWLGTDEFGRDVLSRLLFAARASVSISILSVSLGLLLGGALGLIAGYVGGLADLVIGEASGLLLSFPTIVLGIIVLVALGAGLGNVIIALTVAFVPRFARLVRAETLATRQKLFVEAARATGASHRHIMLRAILPNVGGTALVSAALWTATALRAEATLSFLGLGVQLPYPSWGNMIAEAVTYMLDSPLLVLWPSLAIVVCVVVFNIAGDAIRDSLDPRLTR